MEHAHGAGNAEAQGQLDVEGEATTVAHVKYFSELIGREGYLCVGPDAEALELREGGRCGRKAHQYKEES
ncbi:hypothetical protein GCM10023184_01070 [Flaviaesturariibacter amylovorans]|uniref:Uncharacterized protein n=1 Tax=Flaviaesturariibacter amylovorans TaxID=1084520 RepID=A0ABP8G5D3_9BACT